MKPEQELIKRVAKSNKLEDHQVRLAITSVFRFVVETIESGDRKPVRIPKCGLFSCKEKRVEELAKRNLL